MNDIKDIRFFSAGNAIFTVGNGKGDHYTFRISHSNESQPLFVGLLTGPNNDSDYTYMGIYNPGQNTVNLTKKSQYTDDSQPVKVIRWALKKVVENKELPTGYSIVHEGKCCRCGRTLTTPESIERSFGPECIKHWNIN